MHTRDLVRYEILYVEFLRHDRNPKFKPLDELGKEWLENFQETNDEESKDEQEEALSQRQSLMRKSL